MQHKGASVAVACLNIEAVVLPEDVAEPTAEDVRTQFIQNAQEFLNLTLADLTPAIRLRLRETLADLSEGLAALPTINFST